jgi:signal transduction histidine kinase
VRSSNKTRSVSSAAALPNTPGSQEPAARNDPAPDRPSPGPVAGLGNQPGPLPPRPRGLRRRSLKNWRVRSRLFLLVIIPTVTAVALGGLRIATAVQSAEVYQRVENLANLSGQITGLVQALQNEREDTVNYIVLGPGPATHGRGTSAADKADAKPELKVLARDYAISSGWAGRASSLLRGIGGSYPAVTQQDATAALAAIGTLPALRTAATTTLLPPLVVIQKYAGIIDQLLAINDQVAAGSNDTTLAGTVRVASLISAMKEDASEQQALLSAALSPGLAGFAAASWGPAEQSAFTNAQAEQNGNLTDFTDAATPAQRQLYHNAVSVPSVVQAQQVEQEAVQAADAAISGSVSSAGAAKLTADETIVDASAGTGYLVTALRSVERRLVNAAIARSKTLRNSALTSVIIDSLLVLLVLAVALAFTTIVGTSMVRPLRRLRAGALEVAGLRLPEAVRRMNESDGAAVSLDVQPIDVDSSDEIGEVARAFDQVHREALRLAANEAALRGNVNAMFVNLSRRSQSLVERQIRLIDELEQGEQDAERLASLFQMDHLATRMRRNSENLLVLAGHDVSRRWNQPVSLVDVLRAAVSEIEQYERVTLNVQPGIAVRGQAVSDVVHLTAELVENATSFSPADSQVSIVGHLLNSGGVLLEITDQGVGMGADEMAHANWRLDNPPVVDVAVSRRMGLFVVARLAARHGIRVRLRTAPSGGLTALVWLPDEVVTHEGLGATGPLARFDAGALAAGAAATVTASGGWGNGGHGEGDGDDADRAAAEQEVNAARTPRFAPLRADAEQQDLGPRRVPGAGPRPGSSPGAWPGAGPWAGTTGPLPEFRTSPQPAPRAAAGSPAGQPEPAAADEGTAPQPAVSGTAADEGGSGEATAQFGGLADERAAQPTGTNGGPVPAGSASGSGSGNGGRSILGAPIGHSDVVSPDSGYDWSSSPFGGGVVVPPAKSLAEENRLPIFEAVESDWFRRGRPVIRGGDQEPAAASVGSWASAADEGWRAAEAVSTPMSAGLTDAGLPKRVPQANLVPGAAGAESAAPAPARSAAATRERLASFQRGIREARAHSSGGDAEGGDGDDSS